MTQRFTVVVEIDAVNNTAQAFGEFNKGMQESGKQTNLWDGIMQGVGQRLTGLVQQLPQVAIQALQLGASVEASTLRFERFAGSEERATELLEAFNRGSLNTVDRMGAMTSAARLLQMGLVGNADEMELVAQIATRLGDQTAGATDRINDFALLLANTSIPRLDNFGISSGKVRARIIELQASIKDLSREEAFKIAVMEEGRKSLDILGDTSELASTKMDKLKAIVNTTAQALSLEFTESVVDATSGLEKLSGEMDVSTVVAEGFRFAIDRQLAPIKQWIDTVAQGAEGIRQWREENERQIQIQRESGERFEQYTAATEDAAAATEDAAFASHKATLELELLNATAGVDSSAAFNTYQAALDAARQAEDGLATAALEANRILEEQERQALRTGEVLLGFGATATSFFRDQEEQAESFEEQRQRIVDQSNEKIEQLQRRGQSRTVEIDEEGERRRLAILQEQLRIALEEQSEFNDETAALARLRKDEQIARLQEQLTEQETLLGSVQDGMLTQQGAFVGNMIELEETKRDESLAALEEQMAAQEEAQRMALGRMLLQQFDAWTQISDIAPAKALEMRIAISQEFGLIDEGGARLATNMVAAWEEFAAGTGTNADLVILKAKAVIAAIEDIPASKTINIEARVRQIVEQGGGFQEFQGGGVSGGGLSLVGERGPELVSLPRGAQVFNNTTTQNFNMSITGQAQPNVIQDFETLRSLAA